MPETIADARQHVITPANTHTDTHTVNHPVGPNAVAKLDAPVVRWKEMMPMNTKPIIGVGMAGALTAAVLGLSLMAADVHPKRQATKAFMRQKLAWSQAALEGLTLEKFDQLTLNAVKMRNMTVSNLWFVIRQPDYMAHTTNYQRSVDALYIAAVDKKLDAATDAYMSVVRNCVECHRLVRLDQRKNAGQPVRPASDVTQIPIIAQ